MRITKQTLKLASTSCSQQRKGMRKIEKLNFLRRLILAFFFHFIFNPSCSQRRCDSRAAQKLQILMKDFTMKNHFLHSSEQP